MKKNVKKLRLSRETLSSLALVEGGGFTNTFTYGGACRSLQCSDYCFTDDIVCKITNNPAVTCQV